MRNSIDYYRNIRSSLLIAFAVLATSPAAAETWPGNTPVVGGAIATKVIGEICKIHGPSEAAEIDAYIARYLATVADQGVRDQMRDRVLPELEKGYRETHGKPDGCGAGSIEMATDMLKRIRSVAGDADYWQWVKNPRVGALDAVYAKSVGKSCAGTLSATEIEGLDAFISEEMATFAKSASAADTEVTWTYLREYEQRFATELAEPGACSEVARKDAREAVVKVVAAREAAKR